MEQEIVYFDGLVTIPESELESVIKARREKLRAEKEKKVNEFLCRIAIIPKFNKIFEIKKEFGVDLCVIDEEIQLNLDRLGDIIIYRLMCKEACPAAEFKLCVFGYKDLATKEKCQFCNGHGTAEWDDY